MPKTRDIVIMGGTAAGLAAAFRLAREGCDVVVVDAPRQAVSSPLADWVPNRFFRLPHLPSGLARACRAVGFKRVCYHNTALDKTAQYSTGAAAGHFVRVADLLKALKTAARKAGATVRTAHAQPAIRLAEESVHLSGSVQVAARLLIIAQNTPADALGDLALPARSVPQSSLIVAGLDVPAKIKSRLHPLAGALHIVQLAQQGDLGMFFVSGSGVHLRVISSSGTSGTRAAELSAMVANLKAADILPGGLQLGRARGAVWRPPAGVALDLESHVAKRCLLTGTAGGFADSITGQVLAPSVQSALLAADVALAALASDDVQDSLMEYKTSWHGPLADMLRPPNTSLQMLLPLLFVNRRIVTRFTRAMLYGEPI